jgi:hypothetical protein
MRYDTKEKICSCKAYSDKIACLFLGRLTAETWADCFPLLHRHITFFLGKKADDLFSHRFF